MPLDNLLRLLLKPAFDTNQRLQPNGQQATKYAFNDADGSSEELLKGNIMALPDDAFLEDVDTENKKSAVYEIQKAWVGGYVTGRAWAFEQMGLLVTMYLQHLDDEALEELADYDWDGSAPQQELLNVFSDLAVQFRTAREEAKA